jgi:hypothetical protein
VEGIRVEPGAGFVKVSFVLLAESGDPVAGYISLAVDDEGGRSLGHYPFFNTQRAGLPRDYRRGEWFFTHGRSHVDAVVPVSGGPPSRVRIQAFRRDGRLLMDREVGL